MQKKLVALWINKRRSAMFLITTVAATIVFPMIFFGYICAIIPSEMYIYAFMIFMLYIAIIVTEKQYLDIIVNQKRGQKY